MMTERPGASGWSPARLHATAILALLTFGCTTVRAPASAIAPTVPVRAGAAEPQIELWLESAHHVTPEESARAAAQARAALQQALADRRIVDRDAILVVRAQGVSRTASRRSGQHAATAGIVVGAVALVAVVVVALVASKGSSSPKVQSVRAPGGGGALRPGAPPTVAAARPPVIPAVRPPGVPVPVAPAPRRPIGPVPPPRNVAPPGGARAYADVEVAWVSMEPSPDLAPPDQEGEVPAADAAWDAIPPEPTMSAAQEIASVTLPPPPPLEVERRGFFDGDRLRLELVLVDSHTGIALSVKTVEESVDVRDAPAVREMLDRALADPAGWTMPAPMAGAQ